VGIPDPSFWGWPELLIRPHWQLLTAPEVLPWESKESKLYWRGGIGRRSNSAKGVREGSEGGGDGGGDLLRSQLLHCAMHGTSLKKGSYDVKTAVRGASGALGSTWAPAMEPCKSRVAAFVQGESRLSFGGKQRALACGSVPLFVAHDATDSYFGKFLRRNYHFVEVLPLHRKQSSDNGIPEWQQEQEQQGAYRNVNSSAPTANPARSTSSSAEAAKRLCGDVDKVVEWVNLNEGKAAQGIGKQARRFATTLLGPRMVHEYLLSVLNEVARLQQLHYRPSASSGASSSSLPPASPPPSPRYAWGSVAGGKNMKRVTRESLVGMVEAGGMGSASKGGALEALIAVWQGARCPKERCPRCCEAPATGRRGEGGKGTTSVPPLLPRPPERLPPPTPPPPPPPAGTSESNGNKVAGEWWARNRGKKWSHTNLTAAQRQARVSGWLRT